MKKAYRVFFMRADNLTTGERMEKAFIYKSMKVAYNAMHKLVLDCWGVSDIHSNNWFVICYRDDSVTSELEKTMSKLLKQAQKGNARECKRHADWAATLAYIARYGKR